MSKNRLVLQYQTSSRNSKAPELWNNKKLTRPSCNIIGKQSKIRNMHACLLFPWSLEIMYNINFCLVTNIIINICFKMYIDLFCKLFFLMKIYLLCEVYY